jgi:hypothetical protein
VLPRRDLQLPIANRPLQAVRDQSDQFVNGRVRWAGPCVEAQPSSAAERRLSEQLRYHDVTIGARFFHRISKSPTHWTLPA